MPWLLARRATRRRRRQSGLIETRHVDNLSSEADHPLVMSALVKSSSRLAKEKDGALKSMETMVVGESRRSPPRYRRVRYLATQS